MENIDWASVTADLDDVGMALTGPILDADDCAALRDLYGQERLFRSTIDMARHRFGAGQYRYFDRPLPARVDELRHAFWPRLLAVAREWAGRRNQPASWPDDLDEWLDQCHAAGQVRPTPLMLRYGAGDWNALHRDLYGDLVFPLQVVIGLDDPTVDYTGGEFVVVEQRPRAQPRATSTVLLVGTAWSSPLGIGRCAVNGDGQTRRCVMASASSVADSATRWVSCSTTPDDRMRVGGSPAQ